MELKEGGGDGGTAEKRSNRRETIQWEAEINRVGLIHMIHIYIYIL